jgi:phosphatidate cytidylyltransferase
MGDFLKIKGTLPSMFVKRTLVVILLLPIGLAAIYYGGWVFFALAAIILLLASYEYINLFRAGGYKPALAVALGGTLLFVLGRAINGFQSSPWMISLLILVSMAYHLVDFERGRDQAGTDFSITLAGTLYIGWLGAYLISLREIPDGMWWVLLVLSSVWLADAGAYMIGKNFGRHKITPRLSPKKTWEGYLGGVLVGTLGAAALAALFEYWVGPGTAITAWRGALLGLSISAISILGDLGESMIKRQVGMKDSGSILPGHGGAFDRIDSWLWAGVIGYYMITLLFTTV